jgi:hypothetical protein
VHVSRHNAKKALIDAGDYVKGKHQSPHLRKNHLSDPELQKQFQERFVKPGGVGIVSPKKAVDLCGDITTFLRKNESAGVKGVSSSGVKCKRWKALPCHGDHGKRAASAVFDEQPYKRLRTCG